jgi:hypothetical protein
LETSVDGEVSQMKEIRPQKYLWLQDILKKNLWPQKLASNDFNFK